MRKKVVSMNMLQRAISRKAVIVTVATAYLMQMVCTVKEWGGES